MKLKLLTWVSTFLLVLGVMVPAAAAFGTDDGRAVLGLAPAVAAMEVGQEASVMALATISNLAPGDHETVPEFYKYQYTGPGTANLTVAATLDGDLLTCAGGGTFSLLLTDDQDKPYPVDGLQRSVRQVRNGDTVTFRTEYDFGLSSGNDCQEKSALFTLTVNATEIPTQQPPSNPPSTPAPVQGSVTVRVLDNSTGVPVPIAGAEVFLGTQSLRTDTSGQALFEPLTLGTYEATVRAVNPRAPGSSDIKSDRGSITITSDEPHGIITILLRWDSPLAPPEEPQDPPRILSQGSVTVRAIDASPGNPNPLMPLANAEVTLTGGLTGRTGPDGLLTFAGLDFGTYTANLVARDPKDPAGGLEQRGEGAVTISADEPEGNIVIVLRWDPVSAAAVPPGSITGRICSPRDPGARITAVGPDGAIAETMVASNGKLGQWREYKLTDLAPGTWTVTLHPPGADPVRQTLTVTSGGAAMAADFSLACTGGGEMPTLPVWPFAVGAVLIVTGLGVRRWSRIAA